MKAHEERRPELHALIGYGVMHPLDVLTTLLCWIGFVPGVDLARLMVGQWRIANGSDQLPLPEIPNEPAAQQAEFLFKNKLDAVKDTDDKVRTLLTLSASLLTAVLFVFRDSRMWTTPLAICLVAVTLLCLRYFSVWTWEYPAPIDFRGKQGRSARIEWARDTIDATRHNDDLHDLRVEIFRAARHWMIYAIIATLVAFAKREPRKSIEELVAANTSAVANLAASGTTDSLRAELRAIRLAIDSLRARPTASKSRGQHLARRHSSPCDSTRMLVK